MDTDTPVTRYLATWDRKSNRHHWQYVYAQPWPKYNSDPREIDWALDRGIMRQNLYANIGLSCETTIDDREPRKPNDRRILPWNMDAAAILDHFDAGAALTR